MTIDNISPPGSWANEMKSAPWAYGQAKDESVEGALATVRKSGLWRQASILSLEIKRLAAEIARLTPKAGA
jgi:hypothetical protein